MTDQLTADEVIAQARERGYEITKTQLARWHREGLIPAPARQFPGQGKGSKSIYPEYASDSAVEIVHLLRSTRSFETIGWRLWTYGHEVDERHWKPRMLRIGVSLDEAVAWLKTELDRDRPDTDEENQRYRNLDLTNAPVVLRHVRKAVGDEQFEEAFFRLAEIVTGNYVGVYVADLEGSDVARSEKLIDRVLGLGRARTDKTNDDLKWLQNSIDPELIELSRALASHSFETQVEAGLEEGWRLQRELLLHTRAIVTAFVIMLERAFGDKHKFGFWRASEALKQSEPDLEAILLMCASVFFSLPGKTELTKKFIEECYQFAGKNQPEKLPSTLT